MDKQKLLRIILKDLEELKFLSEEIAGNEGESNLVIDLALSKAKLLCQEITVLKEISGSSNKQSQPEEKPVESLQDVSDVEDEEESVSVAEPELEIINFEQADIEGDLDSEISEEDNETPIGYEEETSEFGASQPEDENADDDLTGDTDEINYNNLSDEAEANLQAGVKEMALDEEKEFETAQTPVNPPVQERPVFREIPKPEEVTKGKAVVGETYQKERSVNDAIGETKSVDSKLTSGPITNLRTAIGLNDRFLFIREIFDNNADKYNTIIENLDKLETIQQAVEFLKANLTLQKNETSMKFVELLKRRFTK